MRLLADEGVDKPIVDLLRASGFDIHYILETNRGIDDEKVLQIANQEERVLLTQDKDFGELVYRLQKVHFGVILFRLGSLRPKDKAALITHILIQHQDRMLNAFTVIQPNAIRIRK